MVQTQRPLGDVFLSASVPDPRRNPKYYSSANLINIRDAVCSLAELVLPNADLIFGGHPAISPMIGNVAQPLGRLDAISIYQSEFFRGVIPPASQAFGTRIRWTPQVPGDRDASLEAMRLEMIGGQSPQRRYAAGFFIGGMEGVEREFELFRQHQPHAQFWPLRSTGGASHLLFDNHRMEVLNQPTPAQLPAADLEELLARELNYRKVFRTLLSLA